MRTCRWLLVAILIGAAALRAGSLPGPFGTGWQHLGATYGIIARNHLRYGLAETRLAMVMNVEPAPKESWVHFSHHPPGMGLTTAGAMALLGDSPLAVRVPGLLFSLLQVGVTYALVAAALSPVAGLAAAFATAVLPAGAYYATFGCELGPQAIALALLALLLDERARERDPRRPRCGAVLAAVAASLFFEWLALTIVAAIALRDLLRRDWRRAAIFAAVVPIAFGLHLLHMKWATGSFAGNRGGSLFDAFFGHGVGGAATMFPELDAGQVLARVARHARFLYTWAGLAAAAAGLVLLGVVAARDLELRRRVAGPLLGTLALAAGYSLPFPRGVVVHRFWLLVALPFVALLIGAAFDTAWRWRSARPAWLAGLALLGFVATRRVLAAQAEERTPFYEELGTALRESTRPLEPVFTTERVTGCLNFYAQRSLRGGIDDALVRQLELAGEQPSFARGWFAFVRPPFDPPAADRDALLDVLVRSYSRTRIELPRSGRELLLFDLSRSP